MLRRSLLLAVLVALAGSLAVAPARAADDQPCLAPYDEPGYGLVQRCPIYVPRRGSVPVDAFQGTRPVEVGRLLQGGTVNWFVCQSDRPDGVLPDRYGDPDYPSLTNRWWAKTQADRSSAWGWVNEIYFKGGLNDEPDAGLRTCGAQDMAQPQPAPAPAPPSPALSAPSPAPAAPSPPPQAVVLDAGLLCTPVGQPVTVRLTVHRRAGRARAEVLRVVFWIRHGARRVDRRAPYRRALPTRAGAGSKVRVHARVVFRRAGSRRTQATTVGKTFHVCG